MRPCPTCRRLGMFDNFRDMALFVGCERRPPFAGLVEFG